MWLALAVAVASFAFVASASARLVVQDGGSGATVVAPAPIVTTSGGFDWGDALVGAGTALGAGLGGLGLGYVIRQRARLVT
jgi:hypothetical protein